MSSLTGAADASQRTPSAGSAASARLRWFDGFGLDVRSLALFRVLLALTLLGDLALRSPDLAAHYTDAGVLPRQALQNLDPFWRISLHTWAAGWAATQSAVFGVQALVGVGLLVGFQTRWMTLLSWLLLVSLHRANPYVLSGGDQIIRAMLFWSIFLPLGACWSLDARRRAHQGSPWIVSVATACFILQLVVMYLFTALLKVGPSWLDGTALHYALHNEYFAHAGGIWARQFAGAVVPVTYGTLALEYIVPFLALLPGRIGVFRWVAVVSFILFHLGIAATMNVGLFPFSCILAWLALIPASAWGGLCVSASAGAGRQSAGAAAAARGRPGPGGIALACVFAYVLYGNVLQLRPAQWSGYYPPLLGAAADITYLNQRWSMFAPEPRRFYTWFVFDGQLYSGQRIDPFRGGAAVSYQKPENLPFSFPSERWRTYLVNLPLTDKASLMRRAHVVNYLIRKWNDAQPAEQRMQKLTLAAVLVEISEQGQSGPRMMELFSLPDPGRRP